LDVYEEHEGGEEVPEGPDEGEEQAAGEEDEA
jgi:hypothetical protein